VGKLREGLSPDLAPSDFHLFGPLKHHLSAEYFPDDETVEREVTAWFRQQPKIFMLLVFRACEMMGQVPQCTGRLC
jgi:hypothetical protein